MNQVTMYATPGCPFCARAEAFLREHRIPFEQIDVVPGSAAWQDMKKKTGADTAPQILIGDEPVGGYADLVALDATGALAQRLGLSRQEVLRPLYDVIIVGGGPAGLSAAVYASRKVLKTLLVSEDIGGQVTWTYDVDNYLGFSQVDAAELIGRFEKHVESYGLEKLVGARVIALDLTGKTKGVITSNGKTYLTRTVIIATGKRPKSLNVPGEKELVGMGVTYCSTCDAPLFAGLDVAVAGGGNSALEAVLDLMKVAGKIYLVSLTPLTADPILQEKVTRSPKVRVMAEHEILRISGESVVEGLEVRSLKTGKTTTISVAGIIIEIGLLPN
ncbi:MAG: FAD-dependent oxidoreductase, partial [Deltaproteobacteria bacterium]|nr:FAD-dependent oxidoreductase [Deltaproteobacteria bacterium]